MAVTVKNNMIIPEVMGSMISAKTEAQLKITPYAKVDTTLQGVAGDTKTVPVWGYIGDASDQNENTQIDYTAMSASTKQFTIKKIAKGVNITTEAINSGMGNPVGEAETQLAKAIAGKVDSDVLDAVLDSEMIYDGTSGIISYDGIVEAVGKFDDENYTDKVMFINPKQETQLLKDSDFLSADKFEAGVAVNGAIGKIAGCWIKKSAKIKAEDAVTAVAGVYTITVGGSVASGDKIIIAGVETMLDGTSGASTSAVVTAIKAKSFDDYNVTGSSSVLTFTEKTGHEGVGAPVAVSDNDSTTLTLSTTTKGVRGRVAMYRNPIIKLNPDSEETEFGDDELPAVTIFLKKDTSVHSEYNKDFDREEIAVYRYYGVALTNEAKVVVAEFAQTAQA